MSWFSKLFKRHSTSTSLEETLLNGVPVSEVLDTLITDGKACRRDIWRLEKKLNELLGAASAANAELEATAGNGEKPVTPVLIEGQPTANMILY